MKNRKRLRIEGVNFSLSVCVLEILIYSDAFSLFLGLLDSDAGPWCIRRQMRIKIRIFLRSYIIVIIIILHLVYLQLFLSFFVVPPVDNIILGAMSRLLHPREHIIDEAPQRDDYESDEARLLLGNFNGLSVTQEAGRHVVGFLDITLLKELVEEQVCPLSYSFELSRR